MSYAGYGCNYELEWFSIGAQVLEAKGTRTHINWSIGLPEKEVPLHRATFRTTGAVLADSQ